MGARGKGKLLKKFSQNFHTVFVRIFLFDLLQSPDALGVLLNAAVGGVSGSAHQFGNAADIVPANGKMAEFEAFLRKWLKGKKWDQVIYETSKSSGARWIHISLYSNKGEQRCKLFGMLAA